MSKTLSSKQGANIAVSDTSPLIALKHVGVLEKLKVLLIIVDLKGRKLARRLGLRIIGTLGLLKLMKLRGLIKRIKPFRDRLKDKGFYISDELVKQLLKDVDETQ